MFLSNYSAVQIIGYLDDLQNKYSDSIAKIMETLRKVACSHLDQNIWLFDYADEITDDINKAFCMNIGRRAITP